MALTQVFFGINVAVFLGMALAGVSITEPTSQELVHWGANWGPRTLSGEWWRLLTCVFVHIGIVHIGLNMWCLWNLGELCESLYGHWTFGAVYLISGVGASLTSVAWALYRHTGGVSAGASGAVFGLAGALIASFYLGEFSLPRSAVAGTLRSVVMFAGYNLVFGAIWQGIDNSAHVGKLATGLVLGALIARLAPDRDAPVRRGAVLVVVLMAVVGAGLWLRHSRSYMIHAQRGFALLGENKTDQAIAELESATRQRPDYLPAHFELAYAYSNTKQFARAEAELQRVLELDPRNEDAYYYLGFVYLDEKRPQQARDAFAQILRLSQSSARAHFGLGATAAAEENYQAAVEEYKIVTQREPGFEGVYFNMGLSYAKLKMYDDAIAALLKEQENSGDNYDTEITLAGLYEAKGMQQQADAARHKAEQLKARQ